MIDRKEKGTALETYVLSLLKKIDPTARLSRGSGNGNDIGDVVSKLFFFECKNHDKKNVSLPIDTWLHLINQLPIQTNKPPIYIYQTNENRRFAILDLEDFFRILKEKYE